VTARLLPVLLLASARVAAQEPAGASQQASYAASASLYFLEDDEDYLQPTVALDRDRLHLEARYNYEDRDTASAWIGINLAAGDALSLDFTPMLGVVAGRTKGIAPGFKVTLGWRASGPRRTGGSRSPRSARGSTRRTSTSSVDCCWAPRSAGWTSRPTS
jgi:hypothetical protein